MLEQELKEETAQEAPESEGVVRQSAAEYLKERIGKRIVKRPIIKDMEGLKQLCNPVADYLRKNCDPHTEVHITDGEIRVTTDECGIPLIGNGD